MPKFDWRQASAILHDRFQDDPNNPNSQHDPIQGISSWQILIDKIFNANQDPLEAFDEFMSALRAIQNPPHCCLFVSHRMIDVPIATTIAYLATTKGYDYWLDVHDPKLAAAAASGISSPVYDILVAAIIEMGLLNSTHVIASHTANSHGSKWIPYEFGRAKQRLLYSSQAAGWFAPGIAPLTCGEYTALAVQTHSSAEILTWLHTARQGNCVPPMFPPTWKYPIPLATG